MIDHLPRYLRHGDAGWYRPLRWSAAVFNTVLYCKCAVISTVTAGTETGSKIPPVLSSTRRYCMLPDSICAAGSPTPRSDDPVRSRGGCRVLHKIGSTIGTTDDLDEEVLNVADLW